MAFLRAVFWEFIQNQPAVTALAVAIWVWPYDKKIAALCAILGGLASALLIRFTESYIGGYPLEPIAATLVNIVAICAAIFLFAAYIHARWGNWRVDVTLGLMAGLLLGVLQGLATPGGPMLGIMLHAAALALAGTLVIISIRQSAHRSLSTALVGSLLIGIGMSVIISLMDYSYLLLPGVTER